MANERKVICIAAAALRARTGSLEIVFSWNDIGFNAWFVSFICEGDCVMVKKWKVQNNDELEFYTTYIVIVPLSKRPAA